MQIALVIGSTISAIKDESIRGRKLLIVRKTDTAGNMTGEPFVAVDTVSAGAGDLVLITDGSSARFTSQTDNAPVEVIITNYYLLVP
jgi:ethanolamine utilization protein EutN